MRKRILSFILVISMLLSFMVALPITASAATSGTCGDNLRWFLDNNGKLTISGTGKMYDVNLVSLWRDEIKSVVLNNGVTSIGEYAFEDCRSLTNITIPNSVTSIGSFAFYDCRNLTSITIPNSVTSIGEYAFYDCESLTSISIPNKITSIRGMVFQGCTGLTSVTIPNSVTSIGTGAFHRCIGLTSITIPNSVTSIGDYAFEFCIGLTSITIPNSVTSIGSYAFSGCNSLVAINVDEGNMYYSSINGVLFNKDKKILLQFPSDKKDTAYTIPDSVKTISEAAFYNCSGLTSITIPNSVTSIGDSAFEDCDGLTSITIPGSVTSIGDYAFYYCTNLKDVYYTGTEEAWKKISIGNNNSYLTKANIHYNSSGPVKVSNSTSTSANAPVIKSAEIMYDGKNYNIIDEKLTINKGTSASYNIKLNIDWNNVAPDDRYVYLTQGLDTESKDNTFVNYNTLTDSFDNVPIGTQFEADKPIYIIAIDNTDTKNKSTSIATKLNVIDLSSDDVYQESTTGDFNFKLGNDTEIQLPDDVPIIGGMKLSWKMSPIPITVAYQSADTLSVAIGCNIVTEDKDGIKKFKDFDFDKYKKSIINAGKKQNRTLKQLRNDFKISNDIKVSMFDDKILSGGSGDVDSGVDVLGYAEVKRGNDGKWKFDEVTGYIKVDVSVSYTYNGQVFVWVIPCYYEIGGKLSAGLEADIESLDKASYAPQLTAYLNAALGINLGAGIGVSKVATFGATGSGTLNLKKGLSDVLEDYIRIWLEADAGYKLVIFGKTIVSDNLWELPADKGIIYSTDPLDAGKTWIKSKSISLMSLEQTYDIYNANAIYENEGRDYLLNPTEWYGDMPPISLFAADYTNKNLTILADSVYPEAQPQIFSINGKKILIFTIDNDSRTSDNKQMLVYSVYNDEEGTWSNAIPVNDDGTADFYPSAHGEYLVWQNQKSVMNDGLSLAEIGKEGEIVIAKWNGNGFDAPVSLTANDALDTLPKVSVNNNEISVVWLKNSADDILGVDGNTSIVKKVYNGSSWGEEIVLKDTLNAVTDLSVGYCDNTLNVAYVHDVDDDITTIDDREVYLIGSSEKQVTDNEVLDSNAIINNGKLYWYSENNIHLMNLSDGTESTVFEDARYTLADGFTVSEDNGNIAILWSGSEEACSEIKGVLYQDGAWGDVITVSELGAYAKYPTCVLEEDGTILTSFTAEADGITSLYTLGLFPSYDLAISDIYFDEQKLSLNSENEFEVMVTNNGELPVEGYTINVYNEDETLNNSIVFEDVIKAGESKAVMGKFITGDAISYENLTVEIELNHYEEYIYDNNTVALAVGNGDISLESLSVYETLPTSYAVADVKNIGYSDISNITVNLRKDSIDGEIVQRKTIPSLSAGDNEEVTFAYNPQNYENTKWFITIETEAEEVSVGNNHDYFINECAVDLGNYEISILNYSYADNKLTVNSYAKNNTSSSLFANAVFAVYGTDGRLKGIASQPLNVSEYSDTGIDVWFENYTHASGDYVKMFMLQDLTATLRPLVNAEQVNVIITQ